MDLSQVKTQLDKMVFQEDKELDHRYLEEDQLGRQHSNNSINQLTTILLIMATNNLISSINSPI